ncbi:hypothetical protein K469DRAFT_549339, partial [Zopfia rhizophila CBS 207.26]
IIDVDGKPLQVTFNLEMTLGYLRLPNASRMIWIDAICIYLDQSRVKHCGNLRLGPLFVEVFDLAHSVSRYTSTNWQRHVHSPYMYLYEVVDLLEQYVRSKARVGMT